MSKADYFAVLEDVRIRLWLGVLFLALTQYSSLSHLFLINEQMVPNTRPASANVVNLGWNPSPATTVTGYFLCYGFASGLYTNRLDVGNVTSVTVGGVETNATYYLTAVAYDGTGNESPPSNEIVYALPVGASAFEAPKLDVQLQGAGSSRGILHLSFQGDAGTTYQLQATEDLQQWVTLWTTNCASHGLIAFETADMLNSARRFYRLLRQ